MESLRPGFSENMRQFEFEACVSPNSQVQDALKVATDPAVVEDRAKEAEAKLAAQVRILSP